MVMLHPVIQSQIHRSLRILLGAASCALLVAACMDFNSSSTGLLVFGLPMAPLALGAAVVGGSAAAAPQLRGWLPAVLTRFAQHPLHLQHRQKQRLAATLETGIRLLLLMAEHFDGDSWGSSHTAPS